MSRATARLATLWAGLAAPFVAHASDMSGFGYLLALQALIVFWPLLLPLAYLRGAVRKLRLYLLLVLVTYGVLGLLSLPMDVYFQLVPWLQLPVEPLMGAPVQFARSGVSLVVAIVVLWKLTPALRRAITPSA